jgi:hypothetical protein
MLGSSSVATQLAASEEGLSSIKFVSYTYNQYTILTKLTKRNPILFISFLWKRKWYIIKSAELTHSCCSKCFTQQPCYNTPSLQTLQNHISLTFPFVRFLVLAANTYRWREGLGAALLLLESSEFTSVDIFCGAPQFLSLIVIFKESIRDNLKL